MKNQSILGQRTTDQMDFLGIKEDKIYKKVREAVTALRHH